MAGCDTCFQFATSGHCAVGEGGGGGRGVAGREVEIETRERSDRRERVGGLRLEAGGRRGWQMPCVKQERKRKKRRKAKKRRMRVFAGGGRGRKRCLQRWKERQEEERGMAAGGRSGLQSGSAQTRFLWVNNVTVHLLRRADVKHTCDPAAGPTRTTASADFSPHLRSTNRTCVCLATAPCSSDDAHYLDKLLTYYSCRS